MLTNMCITNSLQEATPPSPPYFLSWPNNPLNIYLRSYYTILYRVPDRLSSHGDVIFKKEREVVPFDLISKIVNFLLAGHRGIVREKHRLRQLYRYPRMDDI